ncbi:MAG: DUF2834 domain-containing protein [Gammaproteobacteria bacterium]
MATDVVLTSIIFWIFMFHRSRISAMPKPYLFILLTVFLGVSCALPAYLYRCEQKR